VAMFCWFHRHHSPFKFYSRVRLRRRDIFCLLWIFFIGAHSAAGDTSSGGSERQGQQPQAIQPAPGAEGEAWQNAVRSFPNGIDPQARLQALEKLRDMEASGAGSGGSVEPIWVPIGPAPVSGGQTWDGGRIEVSARATVSAVNPLNADDVWLGTANGGVWHSTNGGKNW